jgi:hypothetical protein
MLEQQVGGASRMPVLKTEFEVELVRRGIPKWRFAEAQGIRPDRLSVELRKLYVPDDYLVTLDRIAPPFDTAPAGPAQGDRAGGGTDQPVAPTPKTEAGVGT